MFLVNYLLCSCLLLSVTIFGAPPYTDQRQDGKLNFQAQVDNVLVLVATSPKKTTASELPDFGIFNDLTEQIMKAKYSPALDEINQEFEKRQKLQEAKHQKKEEGEKLVPVVLSTTSVENENEKLKIVKKAEISDDQKVLIKSQEKIVEHKGPEEEKVVFEEVTEHLTRFEKVEDAPEPQDLKLLGDAEENCGPGRERDHQGICQEVKTIAESA